MQVQLNGSMSLLAVPDVASGTAGFDTVPGWSDVHVTRSAQDLETGGTQDSLTVVLPSGVSVQVSKLIKISCTKL